jgi:hypothetical protein
MTCCTLRFPFRRRRCPWQKRRGVERAALLCVREQHPSFGQQTRCSGVNDDDEPLWLAGDGSVCALIERSPEPGGFCFGALNSLNAWLAFLQTASKGLRSPRSKQIKLASQLSLQERLHQSVEETGASDWMARRKQIHHSSLAKEKVVGRQRSHQSHQSHFTFVVPSSREALECVFSICRDYRFIKEAQTVHAKRTSCHVRICTTRACRQKNHHERSWGEKKSNPGILPHVLTLLEKKERKISEISEISEIIEIDISNPGPACRSCT